MSGAPVRVLHATAWYPPDRVGGTEVYLAGLVEDLSARGFDSAVILPRAAGAPPSYRHAGIGVETYPVNEPAASDEIRARRPHLGFEQFRALLSRHRGAIYHQHAWTRGCGPHHLRAAREAGMRTVLTMHVAGAVCLRGTMLKFGTTACDGRIVDTTCGACWAHGQGLPRMLAEPIARLPPALAERARRSHGRMATALAARAHGAGKLRDLHEMIENSDRIVAVCTWLREALAANGVPRDKLVLSRHGIQAAARSAGLARPPPCPPLKLVYLGRWDPAKGIDTVVQAIQALPRALDVHLTIHAIPGADEPGSYEANIRELAGADPRISIAAAIPHEHVAAALAQFDALVVPSLGLETGPLVVLEAHAAELFVLGSRLGGIAELIDAEDAGELVEAGNVGAWSAAIARLAQTHAAGGLPRPARPVRTMAAVAADMADLYHSLLAPTPFARCTSP